MSKTSLQTEETLILVKYKDTLAPHTHTHTNTHTHTHTYDETKKVIVGGCTRIS